MESPFETPFTILEDEPEGRHTRALRPYIEKLIKIDQEKPVHSNRNNTFDVLKHQINEEKLEYWVSDEEIEEYVTDYREESVHPGKRKLSKREHKKLQKKRKKSHLKLTHETQIFEDPDLIETYHFNSQEVCHIRQQMCLSLQARSRSMDQRKLPADITSKDLKSAAITLSGLEPKLKPVYFKKNNACKKISFIRYQSRIIDTLFYLCLFKRKFSLCLKLFKIIISTFGSDIYQIWTFGVYLLTELNIIEFETNFEKEWKNEFNTEAPKLSKKTLRNLSFLKNSSLVPILVCEELNETIISKLKETVSKKRQMQSHIIKFIRLLMRTSRNQFPTSGGFPEQNFVPNGILLGENADTEVEFNESEQEESDKGTTRSKRCHKKKEGLSPNRNLLKTNDESETELEDVYNNEKFILINNAEFNPLAETRQPNQHTYLKSLRRHSTPLHRLGTRTRTPTYTLTLLWILVRTGRIDTLQRIIEPLLLVVPTSTDARVAFSEIMAKFMDVASQIQLLDTGRQGNWEACEALENKMSDLSDSWGRWKDQYTSKCKRMRNVRQYVQYDGVDFSLQTLQECTREAIRLNKQEIKKQESDNESTDESENFNNDEDGETKIKNVSNSSNDLQEEEFVDWENDIETQQELEKLMGYAEMVTKDDDEDTSQIQSDGEGNENIKIEKEEFEEWIADEEDEDEETQKELDRLMGYAEEMADNSASEDGLTEAEKFDLENNQFEDKYLVEYQDSDSD